MLISMNLPLWDGQSLKTWELKYSLIKVRQNLDTGYRSVCDVS